MSRLPFGPALVSLAVALLLVAPPVSAQFGGLGGALKKKAEEETIGKVTDRHDDENKKLRELIDEKVAYDAKFANAKAALAEIDRLEKEDKATAGTYYYLAKATLWYLDRGEFDVAKAGEVLPIVQRGIAALDKAEEKGFKFPPYGEDRVKELKGKVQEGLNKELTKWQGEAQKAAQVAAVVDKLKADFKAEWDKGEARDKAALDLLTQAEAATKAGDVKKAEELLTQARVEYVKIIRPTAESQDDIIEALATGTGARIANAFVELFQKTGDGAGQLREAELLERSRDVLDFEKEQAIYLHRKLGRGSVEGFERRYYPIPAEWEQISKAADESKGVLAKRILTNLKGYNPDARNRMNVIEGFDGYKGQLVWWSETLTTVKGKDLDFDTTYDDVEYYDCRETKKIRQITDDGRFLYEEKCKERKVKRHRGNFFAKVVDPALPSLAKGWQVSVAGTITELKGKKTVVLEGAHVMWVKNPEGKLIWAYGVPL